jgi:gamma-glutamyltranspeptidase / glutathione hydrolase
MNAIDAVNKPKFHHQWLPDVILYEKGINSKELLELQKMGHTIKQRGAIGRTEVIKIINKNKIEIAADSRGEDAAEGY